MAKETYELISTEEPRESDGLTEPIVRRNSHNTARISTIFIFIVFCIIFALVAFKLAEDDVIVRVVSEDYSQDTNGINKTNGSLESSSTQMPLTTIPTISNTTPQIFEPTILPTSGPSSTTHSIANQTAIVSPTIPTPSSQVADTSANSSRTARSVANSNPASAGNAKSAETGFSPLYRKSAPVCSTMTCKTTGSRMLTLLDNANEPCEDFYQFACGGIKENVPSDKDVWKRIWDQLSVIDSSSPGFLQKYKSFYDSCVAHESQFNYQSRVAAVSKLVKEAGKIASEATQAEVDLVKLFSKLLLRRSFRFLDLEVGVETKDTGFAAKISLPDKVSVLKETGNWLELSDDQIACLAQQQKDLQAKNIDLTKIHNAYVECQKKHTVYLNSIENVVRALGLIAGDEASQTQQIQDIKSTIEDAFLKHINAIPASGHQTKKYEIQKIPKLQETYDFIQWKNLLDTLAGHVCDDTMVIQIYSSEYFTQVLGALQKLPKWKVNNALIAIHAQELYENLVVPQARHTREDYCLRLGAKIIPDVSSHIYMKSWSEADIAKSQNLLTKIYNELKTKLTTDIEKAEWADAASKTSMLAKLKNGISLLLNKKENAFNDATVLQGKYDNVAVDNNNNSSFIENTAILLETSRKASYGLLGKPYDDLLLWSNFVNAFDTELKSYYSTGVIVAPMGVIKHPINEEFPGYLTMAQLGLSTARALGRQFDLVGIEHGITLSDTSKQSFNNFRNTMEDKTFLTGTTTLKKHLLTFQGNPQLSTNERIVDNTAVKIVSETLHSLGEESVLPWVSSIYNIEKVFFIAMAQGYCKNIDIPEFMYDVYDSETLPPFLRVKNIITNSEAFQKVFECTNESAMNKNPNKLQFPAI